MIKIKKREVSPSIAPNLDYLEGRTAPVNYQKFLKTNCVDKPLYEDQHGKCYICGRRLCTDMTIDHLKAVKYHRGLATAWKNLYLSCSYCNLVKGGGYEMLLNPSTNNIARVIRQEVDFEGNRFVFTPADAKDKKQFETARLLESVFNENFRMFSLKRRNFHLYAMRKMREFKDLCEAYLKDDGTEAGDAIRRELSEESEFLGLKYWMIAGDEKLRLDFAKEISQIK